MRQHYSGSGSEKGLKELADEALPAIRLAGIGKRFKASLVLQDITWQVPHGHIVGLLGLNGSGKTTLLRLLMGIVHPTLGQGWIGEQNLLSEAALIRQRMGFVPERPNIPGPFTANRLERIGRATYAKWDSPQFFDSLKRFQIVRDKPLYLMSHGQRTLTALAFALAHHADILLLDEPTNGLDPLARREFLSRLIEEAYDQGRTVVLSSHRLEEIEHLAQDVALLHQGKLVAAGPLDLLLRQDRLVSFRMNSGSFQLSQLPGATDVVHSGPQVTVYIRHFDRDGVQRVLSLWGIADWTVREVSLEHFFRERVGEHVV